MWDHNSAATEVAEAITTVKADLRSLVEGLGILEAEVRWLSILEASLVCSGIAFLPLVMLLMQLWPCCLQG
jgi:hypothetical protein